MTATHAAKPADERDALKREVSRLRDAIAGIKQACLDGRVCDEIPWFNEYVTLHDYCDGVLSYSPNQLNFDAAWAVPARES